MKSWKKTWGLVLLIGMMCCHGCGSEDTTEPEFEFEYDYTVVALPDTQHYSESFPAVYMDQTQWIVDHIDSHKIAFVTHLGDIVDNGELPEQWEVAVAAMDLLDEAALPYGTCLGNHDLMWRRRNAENKDLNTDGCGTDETDTDCIGQLYLDHFGPDHFQDRPWYRGASPTHLSNYQIIEASGQEILFLHLAIDPDQRELDWALEVLSEHPDLPVHVSTHRYMIDLRTTENMPDPLPDFGGARFDDLSSAIDQLHFDTSITGDDLFEQFIAVHPNIFMVQCGHVDAEFRQNSPNQADQPVYEMLTDFQEFSPQGGDGWLKLLHFNQDSGQVWVRTYSPTLDQYRQNGDSFEQSVAAVQMAITDFRDVLALITNIDELEELADYLTNTEEGRAEYYELLYGDGHRDSDFILDLDLTDYQQ